MKKILFIMLSLLIFGCSSEDKSEQDKNKDQKIAQLEEKNKTLMRENALYLKNNATRNIAETGTITMTVIVITIIFMLNNFIWLILYKKRKQV